jgi:hypothetical protein
LLNVLGPGTPITPPPTLMLTIPTDGATITNGSAVHATAASVRGIGHVELWLNNYKWLSVPGVPFGGAGQPSADYTLTLPNNVPDGVIDIVVKAFDDILLETDAPMITVTKGAPCATADTCLKGQRCDAGKCFWDPPAGQLGDMCTYDQFCVSNTCTTTDQGGYCTTVCVVGGTDACVAGFDCVATTDTEGVCLPSSRGGGGCCSVERDAGRGWWLQLAGAFGVLAFVCRRRRAR